MHLSGWLNDEKTKNGTESILKLNRKGLYGWAVVVGISEEGGIGDEECRITGVPKWRVVTPPSCWKQQSVCRHHKGLNR